MTTTTMTTTSRSICEEMPLADPCTWDCCSDEEVDPYLDDDWRLMKSDRSKKRKKLKTPTNEKPPSVSDMVKESYKQVDVRGPSRDVRKKLRLVNTELKSYLFKKHRLCFGRDQLDRSCRSRSRPRPSSVCLPRNEDETVPGQASTSVNETPAALRGYDDPPMDDVILPETKHEELSLSKSRRRHRKNRSRTHTTEKKKSRSSKRTVERKSRSPSPTAWRASPSGVVETHAGRRNSMDSSSSHPFNQQISYECDDDEDLASPQNVAKGQVVEREALGHDQEKLAVAGTPLAMGSELLREVENMQTRLRQFRHVNAAA